MGIRKDLHIAGILEMTDVQERWIHVGLNNVITVYSLQSKEYGKAPAQNNVDDLFEAALPKQLEAAAKYRKCIEI